jgi:hypothetical protein
MIELQDNFHFLKSVARSEKKDGSNNKENVALVLMESIITAMKEKELEDISFYEFQDILIDLLIHKKRVFEGHPIGESPLAPLKEVQSV